METELMKSKTEMMSLNNQLLEAVQRRLEMALELEAWKVSLFGQLFSWLVSELLTNSQSPHCNRQES